MPFGDAVLCISSPQLWHPQHSGAPPKAGIACRHLRAGEEKGVISDPLNPLAQHLSLQDTYLDTMSNIASSCKPRVNIKSTAIRIWGTTTPPHDLHTNMSIYICTHTHGYMRTHLCTGTPLYTCICLYLCTPTWTPSIPLWQTTFL